MSPLHIPTHQLATRPTGRFDRGHGILFDDAAVAYDRFRPEYPRAVIDEAVILSRLRPGARLLEVGCGTGKATVAFASRGYRMDCIDPGKNLIAVARQKCRRWPRVAFRSARFEDTALQSRWYDMVLSAQALHWVEPAVRLRKAASLLGREGSLALLYNYPGAPDDETLERLSKLITRESGGLLSSWSYQDEVSGWVREIDESGLFGMVDVSRHRWCRQYSAEEYVGLFRTYSDFLSLPGVLQDRVAGCIHRVITRSGRSVRRTYDCILIHARRS